MNVIGRSIAAVAASWALCGSSSANAQELPSTREGFYELGQQFAYCSAHYAFAAEVAQSNGLVDVATAFEGVERGWTVSGLLFLTEGLAPSRQTEAQDLFETLKSVRVQGLRAERELARTRGDLDYDGQAGQRFEAECGQWVELQQAVIREMRSGHAE